MKQLSLILASIIGLFLTGCVSTYQESVHASSTHALTTGGHLRWYQYNKLWFNNGGKPPAGVGGILYTVFTPSDWFWYGPYEETPKDIFKRYNKKECEGCKFSFEYCLRSIKERQEQIKELQKDTNRNEEILILQLQIDRINENNGLGGDYTTPFEDRF